MTMKSKRSFFLSVLLLLTFLNKSFAQKATISQELRTIKTYAFDEANPVPILVENPKIYPYFKFEGYSHEGVEQEWEVVKLENEYITVYVLPQIGGKIWGAVERKTGEEFLYQNEVIKFRNIAMRGPWTSGGIEFNFGIIGHTPATATPVDYKVLENDDGSVSCIVGTIDLPSRTQWRVEIKLEQDKAFFETNATWYNPTPLNQSYYNWMTGAAIAKDDLEFFIPGNQYLEHGGNAHAWPINPDGRILSNYNENNFGPHKSYHVVGEYKDFFGGYYHDKKFGFGHWSPYEEMPGQKLWLWALSRSGGIWEDLLTDTDGQYIEFQAGRLFNQYFPEHGNNSLTQANFEPYVMDRWREIWFPFKEIGGMEAASEWGVLNVEHENGMAEIGLNTLQSIDDNLIVRVNGVEAINEKLQMKPLSVFTTQVETSREDKLEIELGNGKIYYSNDRDRSKLDRPFNSDARKSMTETQSLYFEAWEAMKYRDYEVAANKLNSVIKLEPAHQDALVKLAELEYRKGNYDTALEQVHKVLEIDTYHPEANYKAGIIYRAMNSYVNALESFTWAARSMTYRSVAYAQMAEISLRLGDVQRTNALANKSLDFNKYNINARYVLASQTRKSSNKLEHANQISEILLLDPLNHFAKNEMQISSTDANPSLTFQNEFQAESNLELALQYYNLGMEDDAIAVLERSDGVKNRVWLAYLLRDLDIDRSKAILASSFEEKIDFVLPYRRESIDAFSWSKNEMALWKANYYLALNYYAVGENEMADQLIKGCGNRPDSEVFYRFRAQILKEETKAIRLRDYEKAFEINNQDWKLWEEAIQLNLEAENPEMANSLAEEAVKRFPENYNTSLIYAKSLLLSKEFEKSIAILKGIDVLPSELGRESRNIFYKVHLLLAEQHLSSGNVKKAIEALNASKQWPENLGVGKPYVVDERLQDYLLSICYSTAKNKVEKEKALMRVVDFSDKQEEAIEINQVFSLLALDHLGQVNALNDAISNLEKSTNKNDILALSMYQKKKIDTDLKIDSMLSLIDRIARLSFP